MNFQYGDNRVYANNDEGEMLAEVTYNHEEGGYMNINHTYVDESLRGQNIASQIMEQTVNRLKSENKKVHATCSYAKQWFKENPEYTDMYVE